jgi:hypothetical protein
LVVLAPADALARAERLDQPVGRLHGRRRQLERADQADRAGLVGQHHGLLGGQDVPPVAEVAQEAARRLGRQPLADVTLGGVRAARELLGGDRRGVPHRDVQAEAVAERHQRPVDHRGDVADPFAHERHQLLLVHPLPLPFAWPGRVHRRTIIDKHVPASVIISAYARRATSAGAVRDRPVRVLLRSRRSRSG